VVRDLVGAAPRSTVMVTSRIVLNVSGEHEYPVRPLTLPANGSADPRVLLRSEAVALFQQRARAVSPAFTIDETTARAAADICARLDGLPLAIELAASRLRLLSLDDLRARLEARLPVLESHARDLPERPRTLRRTIDWSYRLQPAEQAVPRRLSVFTGGATLQTAGAVLGADADPIDGLETLVEHSLLWRDDTAEGHTRYRMLETIREYAAWQLDESGETAELRHRHACTSASRRRRPRCSSTSRTRWSGCAGTTPRWTTCAPRSPGRSSRPVATTSARSARSSSPARSAGCGTRAA
jgi:predicted ATPase